MREAAARAQIGMAIADGESMKADSLAVMEEAMTFFFGLALKEKLRTKMRTSRQFETTCAKPAMRRKSRRLATGGCLREGWQR